jgi:hypothetical protein
VEAKAAPPDEALVTSGGAPAIKDMCHLPIGLV